MEIRIPASTPRGAYKIFFTLGDPLPLIESLYNISMEIRMKNLK